MYRMVFIPALLVASMSSRRKSRLVWQLPGIDDGHGRAYPRRLWNVANTMYCAWSFFASLTQ